MERPGHPEGYPGPVEARSGVSPTTVLNFKRREVEVQRRTDGKLQIPQVKSAELVK
jgi:hypothetical protein